MPGSKKPKKIFVLDTSVILYDHDSINNFEENDIAIPITVLEELDNFKKGSDTKNYSAREFIRRIDELAANHHLSDWISLNGPTKGRLKVLMKGDSKDRTRNIFTENKADHKILSAALGLQEEQPDCRVILVTKDINLRVKAKSLDLPAEDYETGKIKEVSDLYTGKKVVEGMDQKLINKLYRNSRIDWREFFDEEPIKNQYFIIKSDNNSILAYYNGQDQNIHKIGKKTVYGIQAKNAEQTFAIHAILQQDIRLVSLTGVAGTGKTLVALASVLEQRKNFNQIYLSRPIVPLSNKDIGFLPGDIKSKINPYMEPLWDNLKFIQSHFKEKEKEFIAINEMLNTEKLVVNALAYIRGRSISNIGFIIDEAQNLTPHEIKTIITRAGENTKIIFTGDIRQIDTPYLDAQSNGLSYLIDRMKDQDLYAHITLEKGERSELANLANELL
ncbi:PhoH family protein [Hyphobacterium sp. CCMP332]|nr:PhoH family protein [Hyphobacterium sp. CCMP332]